MATTIRDKLIGKLEELARQFEELSERLADPSVLADHEQVRALSVKRAALEPIVREYRAYRSARGQIDEMQSIIESAEDGELVEMAREEIGPLRSQAEELLEAVQKRLVTADDHSIGSVILEIRAGVGGDEAGLWAGDLLAMYQGYAAERRWKVTEMDISPSEAGGFKSVIVNVRGPGVWAHLGYEGGTHQVKRVPATEAQGRIHTSTATVAVLPEPEEVEVDLDPNEVKEMITTSQGPGGQNVNKVATAVHLIHEPTGIAVRIQETKSQSQNRQRAWQLLRARLYDRQKRRQEAERAEQRKTMIGSGDRAEKIRTYRWKENIVVDHRVKRSFNLGEVMAGKMAPLIDALVEEDTARRLAEL